MTKARLRRYFELAFEEEEDGRLDPSDSLETPRLDELDALAAEFEAWDPEAPPPPESAELTQVYDALYEASVNYQQSLAANTKLWNGLCRYWHDRARDEARRVVRSREQLRALLVAAEQVGYYRREWQEAVEKWEECGRHPYYQREAETEKAYYEQARSALYAQAGLPETEEVPPSLVNEAE